MKLADKLSIQMERHNLTQNGIAAALGCGQPRISKWLKGQGEPVGRDLIKLSQLFRVPLLYLCDDQIDSPEDATVDPGGLASMPEIYQKILWLIEELGPARAVGRLLERPPWEDSGPSPLRGVRFTELPRQQPPKKHPSSGPKSRSDESNHDDPPNARREKK